MRTKNDYQIKYVEVMSVDLGKQVHWSGVGES